MLNELIKRVINLVIILAFGLLTSCQVNNQKSNSDIQVKLTADGQSQFLRLPINTTVQDAVAEAHIILGSQDRVDPPLSSSLSDGNEIIITRIKEVFTDAHEIIPYEHQTIKNETLPEGETHLLQSGKNGEKLVTYKKIFENDIQVSNFEFTSEVLLPPVPEIIMIGVQTPITPQNISGMIVYIDNENAWLMESTTGNRRPIVTTGDLDGRVLRISSDREWLLYTRKSPTPSESINSLWVIRLNRDNPTPIDLSVSNIIHFADWVPNTKYTVIYSTVEIRSTAPGWQANNDLQIKNFAPSGKLGSAINELQANSGGVYGWWGTKFEWSQRNNFLAYARPDSIGLVNQGEKNQQPIITILPYDTHADWSWVPSLSWSPYNDTIYTVVHSDIADNVNNFSLFALSLTQNTNIKLVENCGMFSNPQASPILQNGSYLIAYLQAIFPDQSASSRYKLIVMDQDGSNKSIIFPKEGFPGLEPQHLVWSPDLSNGTIIAFLYEGNLWFVDVKTNETKQVTADGLITGFSWK